VYQQWDLHRASLAVTQDRNFAVLNLHIEKKQPHLVVFYMYEKHCIGVLMTYQKSQWNDL
jgi:hypothetical protein